MNRALIERTLAAMDKGYMGHHHAEYAAVMEALRQELEKPEPEPYGWTVSGTSHIYTHSLAFAAAEADAKRAGGTAIPLYAAPTEPNCKFPTCHSQEYQDKLVQEILEPTDGYVQPVPDKCDRIVWRNRYYHLPL